MRVRLALLLALAATPAAAESLNIPKDMVACELPGWSTDRDPAGLNLRAGPTLSASVVAKLTRRTDGANGEAPQFQILGFKDGWFLIRGANYGDYGDPPPKTPLYSGPGWVHGSKVGGQLIGADATLGPRREPDDSSPRLSNPKHGDSLEARALLACKGGWAKVDTVLGAGWVHGLCVNQVTTCP